MPTRLIQIPPQRTPVAQAHLPLRSPFAGYVPDLAQVYRGVDGLISCRAMGVTSGRIVLIDGWVKLDSTATSLPLGHNGDASAFTASGGAQYGAGAGPVTTGGNDKTQPVVHLSSLQRFSAASGLSNLEALAITADTGTVPDGGGVAPFQETGHLFRKINTGTAWTSIEFRSRDSAGAGAAVANAVPLTGTTLNWVDSTVYTPGVPGGTYTDPDTAVVHTVRTTAEAIFIFTNYVDSVMYYPDATGSSNYTDFRSYVAQLVQLGTQMTTTTVQGFYSAPTFETLRAKSVATFGGRAFYFNTVEGSTFFSTRLRWSIAGNPFIVWPSFEITQTAGGSLHFDGVGSGHFDLDQFRTPGQVCRPLGDVLACYSKDGLAFARRTGIVTDPISIEYVTLDRGVLAPGAIAPVHAAQHFAIMSDGWYLVNANGVLQEVGVAPERAGLLAGVGKANKWKNDFYRRLDFNAVNNGLLVCEYEPSTKMVRVSAPMQNAVTEVWNYDTQNDRVFLDDYTDISGIDQTPLSWGQVPKHSGTSISWLGAGPTSWTGYTGRSWASFGSTVYSELELAHGDTNGFVYIHDPLLSTRDGTPATWHFRTAPRSLADNPDVTVLVDGVVVTYDNQEGSSASNATIEVVGYSERESTTSAAYTETGSLSLERGDAGEMAVDDVGFRVPGDNHQIAMTSSGSLSIHELRLRVVVEGTGHRRLEGT